VIRDCRDKASAARIQGQWIAAGVIIAIWILAALILARLALEIVS
jgi:hypothetical protein